MTLNEIFADDPVSLGINTSDLTQIQAMIGEILNGGNIDPYLVYYASMSLLSLSQSHPSGFPEQP